MLLLNEPESEFAKRNHPEHAAAYWGGWNAFIGAMAQAGVIVKGDGLHGPQTATTVRVRDGKRLVCRGRAVRRHQGTARRLFRDRGATGAAAADLSGRLNVDDARRAAETAARASYGRLLALLASCSRDIAASEDALAEAFVAALRAWPRDGVPANPDAWLLTASRNNLKNAARHQAVIDAAAVDLALLHDEAAPEAADIPDERLKLLFVCAHPAIDAGTRTPLMLQTVLGLDADQIAAAFLVAPSAMGQRLVRAKVKMKRQDARLWSRDMIIEAESLLTDASRSGVFGRFQCEAAIQSVHAQRPITGRTDHEALATLYQLLATHCPSVGVQVAQAAAMVDAGECARAFEILDQIEPADAKAAVLGDAGACAGGRW